MLRDKVSSFATRKRIPGVLMSPLVEACTLALATAAQRRLQTQIEMLVALCLPRSDFGILFKRNQMWTTRGQASEM